MVLEVWFTYIDTFDFNKSSNDNTSPESQDPASFPSDPKSIGLSSVAATATYSTKPVPELNIKFDADKSASIIELANTSPAAASKAGSMLLVIEFVKLTTVFGVTPIFETAVSFPLSTTLLYIKEFEIVKGLSPSNRIPPPLD